MSEGITKSSQRTQKIRNSRNFQNGSEEPHEGHNGRSRYEWEIFQIGIHPARYTSRQKLVEEF